jgi:hypothetical protein
MASILEMIARPQIVNPMQSFFEGQQSALAKRLMEQEILNKQRQQLQRESLAQSVGTPGFRENLQRFAISDPKVAETIQKVTAGIDEANISDAFNLISTASAISDQEGQDQFIDLAIDKVRNNPTTVNLFETIKSIPVERRSRVYEDIINAGIQQGFLEEAPQARKTPEQLERELVVKEQEALIKGEQLSVNKQNARLRLAELEQTATDARKRAARRDFVDRFGEVPDGYVRDEKDPTTIRPMTGSAEDIKRKEKELALQRRIKGQLTRTNDVMNSIDTSIDLVDTLTAGFPGTVLSKIPGTQATDLRNSIATIIANIGFDRLSQMRQESPTGGALGQVAIQELEALQKSIVSLGQDQSPERLKKNLEFIKKRYEEMKRKLAVDAIPTTIDEQQQVDIDLSGLSDEELLNLFQEVE